ncbi:hypothetical protein CTTA_4446 [Comamonas testosteroni]|uniref:HTH cro/C1-type domain-containing protein n=1 Tax=Comamonas testosteroni TaxID=285 RepID=A0A5A7MKJ8_COMTE|nr:helix-turn-helix transcriptional regulator [Comamonas testosteroni]GEQ77441.1 hypothetical protein CTTA_4446 [Comamonas testosteroni]
MNLQEFGGRLAATRTSLQLTQDEMADRLGVSKRSYCAYEAGDTSPNAKILAALAECDVDLAYLLTGRKSQHSVAQEPLNTELLVQVIDGLEKLLTQTHRKLTPAAKAQQIVAIYSAFAADQTNDPKTIDQLISHAA